MGNQSHGTREEIQAVYYDLVTPAAEVTNDCLANLSKAMCLAVVRGTGKAQTDV